MGQRYEVFSIYNTFLTIKISFPRARTQENEKTPTPDAPEKVSFRFLKVTFSAEKVSFRILKVSFSGEKVSFRILKVSFRRLKVSFSGASGAPGVTTLKDFLKDFERSDHKARIERPTVSIPASNDFRI